MGPRHSASSARVSVPAELEPLVRQLAALDNGDRDLVIRAATAEAAAKIEVRRASWERFLDAAGAVALGGNAFEDCKALYDE